MGYNDSNRMPKIDEVVYVLESRKQGAPYVKGKVVGINHDDQDVLVKVDEGGALIKASCTSVMFGEDPMRKPEPGVD